MALLDEQESFDDRFARAEDARERWENDFPLWVENETRRVFVADRADDVVGFASARRWGPPPIYEESTEVYLDELFVRPSDRRQGVGTQLVNAVHDWADQMGARRLRLRALVENEAAQAFWAAQEARPITTAFTIECETEVEKTDDEGSKKIGF